MPHTSFTLSFASMDSLSREMGAYIFENRAIIGKFFEIPSTDGEILLPANKYQSKLITKGEERLLEIKAGFVLINITRQGFEDYVKQTFIDSRLLNPEDGKKE